MVSPGRISSNTGKAKLQKQGHTGGSYGNEPNAKAKTNAKRELDPKS